MPVFRPASIHLHALPGIRRLTFLQRLCLAVQRYRQRRALLELDDRLLADVGITRRQAEAEGRKPLWR